MTATFFDWLDDRTGYRKFVSVLLLEEIPGVGAGRKKALLSHFGSARGVSQASLGDLETVEGVSSALARFHSLQSHTRRSGLRHDCRRSPWEPPL